MWVIVRSDRNGFSIKLTLQTKGDWLSLFLAGAGWRLPLHSWVISPFSRPKWDFFLSTWPDLDSITAFQLFFFLSLNSFYTFDLFKTKSITFFEHESNQKEKWRRDHKRVRVRDREWKERKRRKESQLYRPSYTRVFAVSQKCTLGFNLYADLGTRPGQVGQRATLGVVMWWVFDVSRWWRSAKKSIGKSYT